MPATTEQEARDALARQADFAPLPVPVRFTWVGPVFEAHVGKLLLLAGRPKDAVEPLARAAASRTHLNTTAATFCRARPASRTIDA